MNKTMTSMAVLLTAGLALAGCSHMSDLQQRALSGGAIGAAGGAAITAIAGGPIIAGTLIGAGAGATVGALSKEFK
jgi:osmotically inducible lipoprotein OsmB